MRAGLLAEALPCLRALLEEVLLDLARPCALLAPLCPLLAELPQGSLPRRRGSALGQVARLAAGEMSPHGQVAPRVCA